MPLSPDEVRLRRDALRSKDYLQALAKIDKLLVEAAQFPCLVSVLTCDAEVRKALIATYSVLGWHCEEKDHGQSGFFLEFAMPQLNPR